MGKHGLEILIAFSAVALAIILAVAFYVICIDFGIFNVVHGLGRLV